MLDSRNITSSTICLWSAIAILGVARTYSQMSQAFTAAPFTTETWAGNLTGARGLVIDDAGDVLVVAPGLGGIYALWDETNGEVNRTLIVNSSALNHGITLYENHVYASSSSTVWRWNYTAGQRSEASDEETVVVDVDFDELGVATTQGHQTRSLAISSEGILYVSVGSTSNVDSDSFRARIRSFNLSSIPAGGYDFVKQGVVFADGLRNEVGLGFDGRARLWGVENGADQLMRTDLGGDIHNDNPAEELNLFDGKTVGTFYGYPFCWSEFYLPKGGTGRGSQWAWPSLMNETITDAWCKNGSNVRPPQLAMQAHSAPLGITFFNGTNCGNAIGNSTGGEAVFSFACEFAGDAFVTFHGSWDRDVPVGFKVVRIAFDNATGLPMSTDDSTMSDVFGEQKSQTECLGDLRTSCLRPVDVKFDSAGALLVTSDTTSEIIRVRQTVRVPTVAPAPSPSSTAPSSSASRQARPIPDAMTSVTAFVSFLLCVIV